MSFFEWSDNNNFHHLPTRGVQFTWSNGRDAHRHTERRLVRAICNHAWLDLCSSLNVSTLIKHKSDHFPLATNNIVQDLQVSHLIEDSIPNLIFDEVNTLVTRLPTTTEIHEDVIAMNKDGAPGPDGFGARFFQSY